MKITLDNIIFSLQNVGGVSVYWYELLKRLNHNRDIQTKIFQFQHNQNHVLSKKIKALKLSTQMETIISSALIRYLPFSSKVNKNSLFHSSYYRTAKGAKNIITIYDFTYEFYRKGPAKWLHSWQKLCAINKASGIICISENTKKDLYHFFPDVKVPVEVIYIGKSDAFYVLPNNHQYTKQVHELNSIKFSLFIGGRAGYKNFFAMIDALSLCEEAYLVIAGSELSQEELDYLNRRMEGRFISLGLVDDAQLNELYNQAFCFIYPSEYEGFGIPVSESMAAGCPVIALAKSSIPEVAGKAGLLCETISAEILQEYFSVLDDPQHRQQIIKQGFEQAIKFSWDKCYVQTIEFYEKINKLNYV